MFGLPVWQLAAAGVLLAALAGSHWKAYLAGEHRVEAEWNKAKVEQQAAQATADESARLKSQAAALGYESTKAKQVIRYVTVTKEIHDAINADVSWRDQPVPDGLRVAIAAAGQALAAAEPDRSLQLPAPLGAHERPTGGGLRPSAVEPRRLFGAPPIAR